MKKFLSLLASCLTAGALFVGCGGDAPSNESTPQQTKARIGMITNLNVDEKQFNEHFKKLEDTVKGSGLHLASDYVYFDNLNALQSGLDAGTVDEISLYSSVGNYLVARRPELSIIDEKISVTPLVDKFCCAIRSDDDDLLNAINSAIKSMNDDGTLKNLIEKYIVELNGEEPAAVDMPVIGGADTLRIAVTGDLPPLDLIRADGTPAGFNTAVLAEISNRIGKNFELVSVDSAARSAALAAGKVDIIFWVRVPENDNLFPLNADRPDGVDVSDSYFADEIVHVGKTK